MLHDIGTMSVYSVKTKLNQRCTTPKQRFSTLHNVVSSLFLRWYDIISTSVKAISKPIWLVESMGLQKIDKFHCNKRENVLHNIFII